jgi:hypothetical protein
MEEKSAYYDVLEKYQEVDQGITEWFKKYKTR